MIKDRAPFYMGGGTETKLDLQRFAEVSNPYNDELEEDIEVSSNIGTALIEINFVNIDPDRGTISIDQEKLNKLENVTMVNETTVKVPVGTTFDYILQAIIITPAERWKFQYWVSNSGASTADKLTANTTFTGYFIYWW